MKTIKRGMNKNRVSELGSREAFDLVVETHYKGIFNYALRLLGNPDDASDAAQVTFLKAHRSIGEFDSSRPIKPWLYRICMNSCTDIMRTRKRSCESLEQHAFMLESDSNPNEDVERSELSGVVRKAVNRLPERYKSIILLRHYEHLDVEEIAQKLGAPEGTIKSWLFRARALLRSELKGKLAHAA